MGGGAAGFFAAISCAESSTGREVVLLEKTAHFLSKVRISGGGRCNVTHACFEPKEFTTRYPRGERTLISPFHQFQAADTVRWFEERGVKLKTEADGRMFPVTDSSETVIECLVGEARKLGVRLVAGQGVDSVEKTENGFRLGLHQGQPLDCAALLLSTGGCRTPALGHLATSLGHSLQPPVPSLFTFHVETDWVQALAGLAVPRVSLEVPEGDLHETGPLLFTHWGLSGPVVLRTSAWGARKLHQVDYRFELLLNFAPSLSEEKVRSELQSKAGEQPAKWVVNTPQFQVPSRLWEQLVIQSGLPRETRWSAVKKSEMHSLVQQLIRTRLKVSGKSLNKEEFVTCGGVDVKQVDFKTMESKICPRLFFAGEVLDVDGITGGFNFQAAWTTGWIAGKSMAKI